MFFSSAARNAMGWEYMEALRSLATPPQLPPPQLTLPELRRTVSHEGDLLRLQCVLPTRRRRASTSSS